MKAAIFIHNIAGVFHPSLFSDVLNKEGGINHMKASISYGE